MDIILASNSLRRIEMMNELNISYRVVPSNVDESFQGGVKPWKVVKELSKRKAINVFNDNKDAIVLGFDTVVYLDKKILGKPKDKEDLTMMIKGLRGRMHKVYTGSYIIAKDYVKSFYTVTKVYFKDISDEEIIKYSNTKEPYDKAGGYAIQGTFKKYISKYIGDYYSIIGMPKNKVFKILKEYIKRH